MVTTEKAKQLLALHGRIRPQSHSDWKGTLAIPPAVESFYREVGPWNITIEALGNPFFLPRLADLWEFQAGYRWNGISGEPIVDWNDNWLVVADEGGDPFAFDQALGVVLHAYHGEGQWDFERMFPDLNTMAACLAQLGAIVVENKDEYLDEEYSVRPEFRDLAAERLEELLGTRSDAESVLGALGWG